MTFPRRREKAKCILGGLQMDCKTTSLGSKDHQSESQEIGSISGQKRVHNVYNVREVQNYRVKRTREVSTKTTGPTSKKNQGEKIHSQKTCK